MSIKVSDKVFHILTATLRDLLLRPVRTPPTDLQTSPRRLQTRTSLSPRNLPSRSSSNHSKQPRRCSETALPDNPPPLPTPHRTRPLLSPRPSHSHIPPPTPHPTPKTALPTLPLPTTTPTRKPTSQGTSRTSAIPQIPLQSSEDYETGYECS